MGGEGAIRGKGKGDLMRAVRVIPILPVPVLKAAILMKNLIEHVVDGGFIARLVGSDDKVFSVQLNF